MSGPPPQPFGRRSFLTLVGTTALACAGAVVGRSLAEAGGRGAASSAATRPPTPLPKRGSLLIHAGGDTNLDPSYIPAFRTYGYEHAWTGLRGLFERDDLSLVNCECAVSDLGTGYPGKEFTFRGDPAALPAMRAAGVDVANLGNNHAYDYGPEALLDTMANLRANGIAPIGAGKDPRTANEPAIFERNGWTVAVVGFDKVVEPYPAAVAAPNHPGTADGHDLDAMVRATAAAKEDADLVIVAIHWGVELDTVPRVDDVALGRRLVEAGADVIFGGHSHRLQPMGMHLDRPIFYSLGNFIWPRYSVAGATTAVAEVRVTPRGRVSGRLRPVSIASSGHPVLR
jgi:poly-gamma-glutamate synthesis protein (capsule biosynthesis protein)